MTQPIISDALRRGLDRMALAVALHNLEEYAGFEQYAARRGLRVTRPQLQIALALATLLPWVLLRAARRSPPQSRRMVAGFLAPATFAVNAVGHAGQTLAFRDYSPGTATAVGLNLPLALVLYREAHRSGALTPRQIRQTLGWGALLMIPGAALLQGSGWLGARWLRRTL
jgi:hypothetical protein